MLCDLANGRPVVRLSVICLATALSSIAASTSAAPLLFDFTGQGLFSGPITASFTLDSNPVPDMTNVSAFGIQQVFFNNVPGIFDGHAETASTIAFGKGLASQFQILGTSAGFAQFSGDEVFDGTVDMPIFRTGTYNFTGFFSSGKLTITDAGNGSGSTVPEPASWLTMVIGFGIVGTLLRRRSGGRSRTVLATVWA